MRGGMGLPQTLCEALLYVTEGVVRMITPTKSWIIMIQWTNERGQSCLFVLILHDFFTVMVKLAG